jgi:hypothetical protein
VISAELAVPVHGHFNIIHGETGLKADVYPAGTDALNHWGLDRRRRIAVEKDVLWVAPPEYVIIRKLEYWRDGGSEKHLRDIQSILANVANDVDRGLIDREAQQRGLADLWGRAG